MKKLRSVVVATAPSMGWKKLGQPVPLSYFVAASNSGVPQPAQAEPMVASAPAWQLQ